MRRITRRPPSVDEMWLTDLQYQQYLSEMRRGKGPYWEWVHG